MNRRIDRSFYSAQAERRALKSVSSWGNRHQSCDSEQVVGSADQIRMQLHACAAAVARLAQTAHRLHPTEGFLDALTDPLTYPIAGMASSAGVERRAPRPRKILRQVGRDLELPTPGDEGAGVVALVRAQRKATATCRSSAIATAARRSALPSAGSTCRSRSKLLRFSAKALAE